MSWLRGEVVTERQSCDCFQPWLYGDRLRREMYALIYICQPTRKHIKLRLTKVRRPSASSCFPMEDQES